MLYCPPPAVCSPDSSYACETSCFEVQIESVRLVSLSDDESLLNIISSEPVTFTVDWQSDEASSSISGSTARYEHTMRIPHGCTEELSVQIDTYWDSPYGDGVSIHDSYDKTYTLGCVDFALDAVSTNPRTLRRGDWITFTFDGSGFGSPSRGSVQFYSPTGTLLADLAGTISGDPNLDIHWSDTRITIEVGPGYTSTYDLGWFPFKARVRTDTDGYTDLVWGGFTVTD